MVIYADAVFALNFVLDYLILLCTAVLSGVYIRRSRAALGAAFGGVYAVLALVPRFAFLLGAVCKLLASLVMAAIVFCSSRPPLRVWPLFLAVSAFFAGLMYAVELTGVRPGFPILALSFLLGYTTVTLLWSGAIGTAKGSVEVKIVCAQRSVTMRALHDTGNTLRDPISGMPVIVAEMSSVLPLFDDEAAALLKTLGNAPCEDVLRRLHNSRFRLIPYSAVGAGGLLLAFRPDAVTVAQKTHKALIAISPDALSAAGTYTAITGV